MNFEVWWVSCCQVVAVWLVRERRVHKISATGMDTISLATFAASLVMLLSAVWLMDFPRSASTLPRCASQARFLPLLVFSERLQRERATHAENR